MPRGKGYPTRLGARSSSMEGARSASAEDVDTGGQGVGAGSAEEGGAGGVSGA